MCCKKLFCALVLVLFLFEQIALRISFHRHRLLTGGCTVGELVMTGGLWRVTGAQVAQAAAEPAGTCTT